jgi:serine/threonine protein kinase
MDIEEAAKKFYESVRGKLTLKDGEYILDAFKWVNRGLGLPIKLGTKNTQETVVIKTYDPKLDRDPNFKQFKEQFDRERQQIFDIRQGMFPIPNVGPPCLVQVKESYPPQADEGNEGNEGNRDQPQEQLNQANQSAEKAAAEPPSDRKGNSEQAGGDKEEEKNPQSFLAMYFVAGKSLADLVKERGKLDEKEAVKYIDQIGKELQKLHAKGFIHKDINPKNIILQSFDNEMKAVLVDYGLARHIIPDQFPKGRDPGLKPYDPPEQVRGGPIVPTPAYDIYSLAATLYFAVTGTTPIPAATRYSHKAKQPAPRQSVTGLMVSNALNRGVSKGMELRPSMRPGSIEQWLKMIKPKDVPWLLLAGLVVANVFLPNALVQDTQSPLGQTVLTAIILATTFAVLAVNGNKVAKKLDTWIMAFLYILLGLGLGLKIATFFALSMVGLFSFWSQGILKKSFMPWESIAILVTAALFGIVVGITA